MWTNSVEFFIKRPLSKSLLLPFSNLSLTSFLTHSHSGWPSCCYCSVSYFLALCPVLSTSSGENNHRMRKTFQEARKEISKLCLSNSEKLVIRSALDTFNPPPLPQPAPEVAPAAPLTGQTPCPSYLCYGRET